MPSSLLCKKLRRRGCTMLGIPALQREQAVSQRRSRSELRTAFGEVREQNATGLDVGGHGGLERGRSHHVLIGEVDGRVSHLRRRPVEHSDDARGSVDQHVGGV